MSPLSPVGKIVDFWVSYQWRPTQTTIPKHQYYYLTNRRFEKKRFCWCEASIIWSFSQCSSKLQTALHCETLDTSHPWNQMMWSINKHRWCCFYAWDSRLYSKPLQPICNNFALWQKLIPHTPITVCTVCQCCYAAVRNQHHNVTNQSNSSGL